jgi:uncharacterized protein YbjT (DUF2867 family)
MSTDFLITGGTGTLGRLVEPRLRATGADVRVLSRRREPATGERSTGDLATGAGIPEAVSGVHTVVHCAGTAKGDDHKARTLVRAATRAGVRHIVFISVVGADRVPVVSAVDRMSFGYYAAKYGAEQAIAGSDVPWTTLRATQFHDLTLTAVQQLARLPLIPVPSGIRFQPVDAAEVADRLVELAVGEPAGLVPDLGGPRAYGMDELVRGYLRTIGRRRPIIPVRFAGSAYRAMRSGANLAPDRAVGLRTWEDFLADRMPARA